MPNHNGYFETRAIRRILGVCLMLMSAQAFTHEPVAKCVQLEPGTVRCRGASNDGDEMPGARMEVIAHDGRTLVQGKLDARSTLTFKKPAEPFYVLFDTGPGLQSVVEQEEIGVLPSSKFRAPWMSH